MGPLLPGCTKSKLMYNIDTTNISKILHKSSIICNLVRVAGLEDSKFFNILGTKTRFERSGNKL